MVKKQAFSVIALFVVIASASINAEWSADSDKEQADEFNEGGVTPMQTDPRYEHFFNGSYGVHDVLKELLYNRSLTSSTKM